MELRLHPQVQAAQNPARLLPDQTQIQRAGPLGPVNLLKSVGVQTGLLHAADQLINAPDIRCFRLPDHGSTLSQPFSTRI